ncbi:MAG TPA: Gfo/Idh/MocA family oxidoreductase [Flavisolibacter sp.]|jgi:predicted dehydrogenase|nr:Gfo/Idh/MocA family oxidoreductase [Flavisolibacter sp.]
MNKKIWESLIERSAQAVDRRSFLSFTGKGLLASSVLSQFAGMTSQAQSGHPSGMLTDTVPIQLTPLDDPSEKKASPPPAPLDPSKRIRYALVGLGHLTLEELLPAFGQCQYSRPVALVSGDMEKARRVATQYGIASKNLYTYDTYDSIKNNPEIDAVYIVLPNSMHEEFTIRAANAGKHVLCEKPMATSSAAAERMIAACKKAGKKLMVAYRIQYEPMNRQVMQWTRTKKWGQVKVIELFNGQHIGDPHQWRLKKALAGGGALPDIGLYCLNTARFLLGEEPEWVLANSYSTPTDPRFREVEETMLFQMGFPGGTVVNAGTSYSTHESRRYRCMADRGGWFGMDPAFSYHGLQMEVDEVRDGKPWKENPSLPEKNQFALEIDHMSQCILNNQQPYTPGEEGLQDHRIMEALYQSAKEKKIVQLEKISKIDAFRGTPPKEGS